MTFCLSQAIVFKSLEGFFGDDFIHYFRSTFKQGAFYSKSQAWGEVDEEVE